mmetsp:Transcript_31701/g.90074  ORF Transcript_31701/g.90074 Transcript_31701/m.90074 type:complete len:145 (+) Transcript_31701:1-435(+)
MPSRCGRLSASSIKHNFQTTSQPSHPGRSLIWGTGFRLATLVFSPGAEDTQRGPPDRLKPDLRLPHQSPPSRPSTNASRSTAIRNPIQHVSSNAKSRFQILAARTAVLGGHAPGGSARGRRPPASALLSLLALLDRPCMEGRRC